MGPDPAAGAIRAPNEAFQRRVRPILACLDGRERPLAAENAPNGAPQPRASPAIRPRCTKQCLSGVLLYAGAFFADLVGACADRRGLIHSGSEPSGSKGVLHVRGRCTLRRETVGVHAIRTGNSGEAHVRSWGRLDTLGSVAQATVGRRLESVARR